MTRQIFCAIIATSVVCAEHAITNPLGFNKIVCLTNSDTIVGVPFRTQGSPRTLMAGAPGTVAENPDLAEISLQAITLEPGSLDRHYLKFEGGTRDGRWYDITANSTTSVTIDLNGDNLDGVGDGNPVIITEYWTLNTLFPPDQATTSWTENPQNPGEWIQNGNAIVASMGTLAFQRRTTVLLPDIEGGGINRSASGIYFTHNGQWYTVGGEGADVGATILYPGSILTVRHPSTVTYPTVMRTHGEVTTSNMTLPLHTDTSGARDTFVGLPRPVDVTLSQAHIWESGAFVASLGNFAFQRRDQLLVFDNTQTSINKSAVALYFHNGTNWLAVGDDQNTNRDGDVIPAGAGFIVRKYQTDAGVTDFWNNIPSY